MTSQNSGKPQELCGSDAPSADGSLRDFYTDCFSKQDAQIKMKPSDSTRHIFNASLPNVWINGHCPEEGFNETAYCDGMTFTRETGKFRPVRDSIINVRAKDSSFFQEGTGANAYRRWTSDDGRQMFIRHGNQGEMHFKTQSGEADSTFTFDIQQGTFWRQYGDWKLTQHTLPQEHGQPPMSQPSGLDINVTDTATGKKTSLDFIDPDSGFRFHVSKNGIEITPPNSQTRLLLVGKKVFRLAPNGVDADNRDVFFDDDGNIFDKLPVTNPDLLAALGVDTEKGGFTIMGLTVNVGPDGSVTAQSSGVDGLTITIGADGSQTVTSNDGLTTKVNANGKMQVCDEDSYLGYFDPFSGMIGNGHITLGADCSWLDGKAISVLGYALESAMLSASLKQVEHADRSANSAIVIAGDAGELFKKQCDAGMIDQSCFGALNMALDGLNNALSECLAVGARDNVGRIISYLGQINSQLTQAQAKYKAHRALESLGTPSADAIAKVEKLTGTFSNPMANAKHVAERTGTNGQAFGNPAMAQHVNVA